MRCWFHTPTVRPELVEGSLSKGLSWVDKPVLSRAEGLTTDVVLNWVILKTLFSSFVVSIAYAYDVFPEKSRDFGLNGED